MATRLDVMKTAWSCARLSVGLMLIVAAFLGSCAATEVPRDPQLFFSGRILDEKTMKPIEGAYVIAGYYVALRGPLVSTTQCVKTLGMYTNSDGAYRFPIERLDNLSPSTVSAIK